METQNATNHYPIKSAGVILLMCLLLFSLDHETKQITDLMKPGNLVALVWYFVPVYLICYALFIGFNKAKSKHSTTLALSVGIPVGFAVVMVVMGFVMGRL